MAGLLFVTQAILDTWAGQGKIEFAGNVMTILSGEGSGRSYTLQPAVRFLQVIGADSDPHGLVRKVKGEAQLREMGAEVLSDAVILGEVAYQVEPGFFAEGAALQAAAASAPDPARVSKPPFATPLAPVQDQQELEKRRKEAEALARFLLENLS